MSDAQLVLHHVVIKGLADLDAVVHSTGLAREHARRALDALAGAQLVIERSGRVAGFAPTPDGRAKHVDQLADDVLRLRKHGLAEWYSRFEVVNDDVKALCTAWQLVDGADGPVPNDHTDAEYDAAIVHRLVEIHATTEALLGEVGHARLDRYRARLAGALAAVQAGHTERFTTPLADSYHDIWMELHHDLLVSFGRERSSSDA